MSKIKLTPEQLAAVEAHGGTIIVSAAAGSGKTAVLVERVIRMLTDREDPVPADRLLIVTFTRDAAAEMRNRLNSSLTTLLAADPENAMLRRQKLLLSKAAIGTIHSFCSSCLREFFARADVAPDFRIAEPAEAGIIKKDVLSQLIENSYSGISDDPGFEALAGQIANDRFGTPAEMIEQLDSFVSAFPDPEEKLAELAALYDPCELPEQTGWGRYLLDYARKYTEYLISVLDSAICEMDGLDELSQTYGAAFSIDRENLAGLLNAFDDGWAAAYDALNSFSLVSLSRKEYKAPADCPDKEAAAAARSTVSDGLKAIRKLISISASDFLDDIRRLQPAVKRLCQLTAEYRRAVEARKSDKRILEFDDLEHLTAKLLVRHTEHGWERTETAKEISGRYDEILLDEYQDTNYSQDLIFRAISLEDGDLIGEGTNMFMVGDIKQSIYRFRKAVPQLFLRRLESYSPYNSQAPEFPAKITLRSNFRSRKEIIGSVNFLFEQLMVRERGGIVYDSDEQRLFAGKDDFPALPGQSFNTELHIIDASKTDDSSRPEDESRDIVEARYCARLISRMMQEGFMVTEGSAMRPAEYRDFCVLRRSVRNQHGDSFLTQFAQFGIPVAVGSDCGFFAAPEIRVMMSLLRAIDNPLLDIPLLAALCSPIFGFDCDRAAVLRADGGAGSLYSDLIAAAERGDDDCIRAAALLTELRDLSAAMPSDRLISTIYHRTGYLAAVQAGANGSVSRANLLMLLDKARSFESSGFKGLSRFIGMMNRLEENGGDFPEASVAPENCVTVRTMHKSKGLQFPICIIAGLGGNAAANSSNLVTHSSLGLGMNMHDSTRRVKYATAQHDAVALANHQDDIDEELRVLYVALTRPVDKLIMLYSASTTSDNFTGVDSAVGNSAKLLLNGSVSPFALGLSAVSGRWLTAAAMRHPSGNKLRDIAGLSDDIVISTDVPLDITLVCAESPLLLPPEEIALETADTPQEYGLSALIRERLDYRYPYAHLHSVPSKVTASGTHSSAAFSACTSRPSFMLDKGLSPTERGTALHRFMQFCDFSLAASDPEAELARLVHTGHLSVQESRAVDLDRVRAFFSGEMAQILAKASRIEREWRFTALLEPEYLHYFTDEDPCGEPVVLEGECDLLLFTDSGAVVVDYKTDHVSSPEQLAERYAPQLLLYVSAVSQVTGMDSVSCAIYSFGLSKLVKIPN